MAACERVGLHRSAGHRRGGRDCTVTLAGRYRRPHIDVEATVAKPFRPRTVRQAILLLALLIVLAGVLAALLDRTG